MTTETVLNEALKDLENRMDSMGDADKEIIQDLIEGNYCELAILDSLEAGVKPEDLEEFLDARDTIGIDAAEAGLYLEIPANRLIDAYHGEYTNSMEFAENLLESTGELDSIPEHLQGYFDTHAYARDLMHEFSEHNGHFFSDYY